MNSISVPQRPIIIAYHEDDEIIHDQEHPFCSDKDCPCHADPELIAELVERLDKGEITWKEGFLLFWGIQPEGGE